MCVRARVVRPDAEDSYPALLRNIDREGVDSLPPIKAFGGKLQGNDKLLCCSRVEPALEYFRSGLALWGADIRREGISAHRPQIQSGDRL